VDSKLATVGTANFDYRSLFVNYELNLFSADPVLCIALERQFATDLDASLEVTSSSWDARPWSRVITETLGWIGRRWL
jgi:cardiolipin synthase